MIIIFLHLMISLTFGIMRQFMRMVVNAICSQHKEDKADIN